MNSVYLRHYAGAALPLKFLAILYADATKMRRLLSGSDLAVRFERDRWDRSAGMRNLAASQKLL